MQHAKAEIMKTRKQRFKTGTGQAFTLIELLVKIPIIAALAAKLELEL